MIIIIFFFFLHFYMVELIPSPDVVLYGIYHT